MLNCVVAFLVSDHVIMKLHSFMVRVVLSITKFVFRSAGVVQFECFPQIEMMPLLQQLISDNGYE